MYQHDNDYLNLEGDMATTAEMRLRSVRETDGVAAAQFFPTAPQRSTSCEPLHHARRPVGVVAARTALTVTAVAAGLAMLAPPVAASPTTETPSMTSTASVEDDAGPTDPGRTSPDPADGSAEQRGPVEESGEPAGPTSPEAESTEVTDLTDEAAPDSTDEPSASTAPTDAVDESAEPPDGPTESSTPAETTPAEDDADMPGERTALQRPTVLPSPTEASSQEADTSSPASENTPPALNCALHDADLGPGESTTINLTPADPDGDELDLSIDPAWHGTAELVAGGTTVAYTAPDPSDGGVEQITVYATDPHGASAQCSVRINLTAGSSLPSDDPSDPTPAFTAPPSATPTAPTERPAPATAPNGTPPNNTAPNDQSTGEAAPGGSSSTMAQRETTTTPTGPAPEGDDAGRVEGTDTAESTTVAPGSPADGAESTTGPPEAPADPAQDTDAAVADPGDTGGSTGGANGDEDTGSAANADEDGFLAPASEQAADAVRTVTAANQGPLVALVGALSIAVLALGVFAFRARRTESTDDSSERGGRHRG